MIFYDLVVKHQVARAWSSPGGLPDWMLDAAEEGRHFAAKCFPQIAGTRRPAIRWFTGPATEHGLKGLNYDGARDVIWLSAKMASFGEVLEVSAHEHCHAAGYDDEDVPDMIGRLAVKHRSGERVVYIHRGDLRLNWMPSGVDELPSNAVVLELEGAGADTYTNHGTSTRPSWSRVNIG